MKDGAVLDIGTNSVRLILARVSPDGVETLFKEVRVTRLGEGVDTAKRLRPGAIDRTLDTLTDLVALVPPGVPLTIMATSAVRDACNGGEFAQLVQARTGVPLQILSGDEEAKLSFLGAAYSLRTLDLPDPITVVDVGGGSTEIYTGTSQGELLGGGSVSLGAVRLLERCEDRLPAPTETEILAPLVWHNLGFRPQTLVAVGGTATSLAAIIQDLKEYSGERVQGFSFSIDELEDCYRRLGRLSLAERRQTPSLQAGREDVIVYGAAILVEVARMLMFSEILVSTGDLLTARLLSSEY